jgi:hypothetical protein
LRKREREREREQGSDIRSPDQQQLSPARLDVDPGFEENKNNVQKKTRDSGVQYHETKTSKQKRYLLKYAGCAPCREKEPPPASASWVALGRKNAASWLRSKKRSSLPMKGIRIRNIHTYSVHTVTFRNLQFHRCKYFNELLRMIEL